MLRAGFPKFPKITRGEGEALTERSGRRGSNAERESQSRRTRGSFSLSWFCFLPKLTEETDRSSKKLARCGVKRRKKRPKYSANCPGGSCQEDHVLSTVEKNRGNPPSVNTPLSVFSSRTVQRSVLCLFFSPASSTKREEL